MKPALLQTAATLVAAVLFSAPTLGADPVVTGAGSTAAAPIYQSWAREYQKSSHVGLQYEAIGSSAGLKKIRQGEVGYGASDVAPSDAELSRDGLAVFPVAISGIAPVIRLAHIGDGQLRLTGDVLARIFMGTITRWNAPEIAQLNPGLPLPSLPIKVVVRSDGSGTTYNFADYLAKVHPAWKDTLGVKTALPWPEGFLAVKGSDGVVKAVSEAEGAIGYVDFGYVKANRLTAVQLKNADGAFLRPSNIAFQVALANSDWTRKGKFTSTLTHQSGAGAWPITMGTFVLVPRESDKPEQTERALAFLVWAFLHGDQLVQENNFVRIPDQIQAAAFKTILSLKDKTGRALGLKMLNTFSQ